MGLTLEFHVARRCYEGTGDAITSQRNSFSDKTGILKFHANNLLKQQICESKLKSFVSNKSYTRHILTREIFLYIGFVNLQKHER